MSGQNQSTYTDDSIDLKQLFFMLLRQWKIIVACVVLALLLALLYLRVTSPTYAVNGLIQVEDNKNMSTALLGDVANLMEVQSPAQTEVELIKSRFVLSKVIENLNLDISIQSLDNTFSNRLFKRTQYQTTHSPLQVIMSNSQGLALHIRQLKVPAYLLNQPLQLHFIDNENYELALPTGEIVKGRVGRPVAQMVSGGLLQLNINKALGVAGSNFSISQIALQTMVDRINAQLSAAEKGKLTGIISVNYTGSDKVLITNTLNEILKVYLEQNITRKSAESQNTLAFLDKQLPELKAQLEASENRFNQFRERNDTIDVTKESELLLTQNVELETRRIELEQKRAELGAKYTGDFPLMKQVTDQLDAIAQRTKELNQRLNRLPEVQRQYLQLYRDVQINTELYTSLLNSYQQLKVVKAGQIGNATVVDPAILPLKPVQPKPLMVLILSIFLGGFVGILLALLRNMLSSGVKDAENIEAQTGLPVYATLAHSPILDKFRSVRNKTLPLLALEDHEDLTLESLRSLRTVLYFAQKNARNNVVLITGPAPEIGKSFICANLATILAQTGKIVLLIDADMRRGHMHKYFDASPVNGLADYLGGSKVLNARDIIQDTPVKGLSFVSKGQTPANPSELLLNPAFENFLKDISEHYDHVIIDSPPLLAVTDGIIISKFTGLNLLIARYGKTPIKEIKLCMSRLQHSGQNVHGLVLNDVPQGALQSEGYSYTYKYRSKS
ncbi:tyrosine protein kinase [Alkanindiges hydrocarboniclasticus]|uniref:Tyrosine protein kinase n=1 Tax=Alkanindiges hydrocarboniclasticus TaxID=1907941 RepID=A0A1S8CU61_9GAMM|nr:polysaccharide biosynthesis tyrosine autokinase [Alkanindiges hydrocarboniclasticus]ONG40065.1 tyrosine protein kinase [Alkanindiges hydrocarboniclasticus]